MFTADVAAILPDDHTAVPPSSRIVISYADIGSPYEPVLKVKRGWRDAVTARYGSAWTSIKSTRRPTGAGRVDSEDDKPGPTRRSNEIIVEYSSLSTTKSLVVLR
jgi:hypothetical protein